MVRRAPSWFSSTGANASFRRSIILAATQNRSRYRNRKKTLSECHAYAPASPGLFSIDHETWGKRSREVTWWKGYYSPLLDPTSTLSGSSVLMLRRRHLSHDMRKGPQVGVSGSLNQLSSSIIRCLTCWNILCAPSYDIRLLFFAGHVFFWKHSRTTAVILPRGRRAIGSRNLVNQPNGDRSL